MNLLSQAWAATEINLRGLGSRIGSSVVVVTGVAMVVAVTISFLTVGAGLARTVHMADQPDRAIVLSADTPSEDLGDLTTAQVALVADAPGVKRTSEGEPVVQPLAAVPIEMTQKGNGAIVNVLLRGTGDMGARMNRATLHMSQGRTFRSGLHELVVGKALQSQFDGLELGDSISIRGAPWKVVGVYEDQGAIDENSIAADANTVLAAFGRPNYQSIGVQLASPREFENFKDSLTSNPQLRVQVKRLDDYYRDQTRQLTDLFNFIGLFVGTVMAVGATCGALTTMYSAVEARMLEMATLRAIGFAPAAVVISVLVEALLVSAPGALVGVLIAWLAFDNRSVATGGLSFALAVTPALALIGVAWALAIALAGGLAPALRAASRPIAEALRNT